MIRHLERENEVTFDKIFNQKIGELIIFSVQSCLLKTEFKYAL